MSSQKPEEPKYLILRVRKESGPSNLNKALLRVSPEIDQIRLVSDFIKITKESAFELSFSWSVSDSFLNRLRNCNSNIRLDFWARRCHQVYTLGYTLIGVKHAQFKNQDEELYNHRLLLRITRGENVAGFCLLPKEVLVSLNVQITPPVNTIQKIVAADYQSFWLHGCSDLNASSISTSTASTSVPDSGECSLFWKTASSRPSLDLFDGQGETSQPSVVVATPKKSPQTTPGSKQTEYSSNFEEDSPTSFEISEHSFGLRVNIMQYKSENGQKKKKKKKIVPNEKPIKTLTADEIAELDRLEYYLSESFEDCTATTSKSNSLILSFINSPRSEDDQKKKDAETAKPSLIRPSRPRHNRKQSQTEEPEQSKLNNGQKHVGSSELDKTSLTKFKNDQKKHVELDKTSLTQLSISDNSTRKYDFETSDDVCHTATSNSSLPTSNFPTLRNRIRKSDFSKSDVCHTATSNSSLPTSNFPAFQSCISKSDFSKSDVCHTATSSSTLESHEGIPLTNRASKIQNNLEKCGIKKKSIGQQGTGLSSLNHYKEQSTSVKSDDSIEWNKASSTKPSKLKDSKHVNSIGVQNNGPGLIQSTAREQIKLKKKLENHDARKPKITNVKMCKLNENKDRYDGKACIPHELMNIKPNTHAKISHNSSATSLSYSNKNSDYTQEKRTNKYRRESDTSLCTSTETSYVCGKYINSLNKLPTDVPPLNLSNLESNQNTERGNISAQLCRLSGSAKALPRTFVTEQSTSTISLPSSAEDECSKIDLGRKLSTITMTTMVEEPNREEIIHMYVLNLHIESIDFRTVFANLKVTVGLYNPINKNILIAVKDECLGFLGIFLTFVRFHMLYVCWSNNLLETLKDFPPQIVIYKTGSNRPIASGCADIEHLTSCLTKRKFQCYIPLTGKYKKYIGRVSAIINFQDLGVVPGFQDCQPFDCFLTFKKHHKDISTDSEDNIGCDLQELLEINKNLGKVESKINIEPQQNIKKLIDKYMLQRREFEKVFNLKPETEDKSTQICEFCQEHVLRTDGRKITNQYTKAEVDQRSEDNPISLNLNDTKDKKPKTTDQSTQVNLFKNMYSPTMGEQKQQQKPHESIPPKVIRCPCKGCEFHYLVDVEKNLKLPLHIQIGNTPKKQCSDYVRKTESVPTDTKKKTESVPTDTKEYTITKICEQIEEIRIKIQIFTVERDRLFADDPNGWDNSTVMYMTHRINELLLEWYELRCKLRHLLEN